MKIKLTFRELRELKPHPLCALLNSEEYQPSREELEILRSSIAANGVRARVVLMQGVNGEMLIADGTNTIRQFMAVYGHGRTEAEVEQGLIELGANTELLEDLNEDQIGKYILAAQLGRRNLDAAQRAALVIDAYQLQGGAAAALSLESLAEISSTSRRTVINVRRVDREGCTALQHAIRIRSVSLDDAIDLLELSKGEQAEVLDRLKKDPRAVKAEVARIRAERERAKAAAPALVPSASAASDLVAAIDNVVEDRGDITDGHASPAPAPEATVDAPAEEIASPLVSRAKDAPATVSVPPGAAPQKLSKLRMEWRAATLVEKKEFAVMDGDQMVAMRRDATVRPPTGPPKADVLRVAGVATRAMPRNEHVQLMAAALHEWSRYVP
jgi:hypothetical protein